MKIFRNKAVSVTSLIVGTLLVVYAILSKVIKDVAFFQLDKLVGNLIIGVGLIVFASLVVLPQINKSSNKTAKSLRIVEFIILLVGALIGFILPAFNVEVPAIGSGSLWIGLALIIHGGVDLFLGTHGKSNQKGLVFFVSLLAVALGGYVIGNNTVDGNLELVSFVALLGAGLFLLLTGLLYINKTPSKKEKKVKTKKVKEKKTKESKSVEK